MSKIKINLPKLPDWKFSYNKHHAGVIEYDFPEVKNKSLMIEAAEGRAWWENPITNEKSGKVKIKEIAKRIYLRYAIGWTHNPSFHREDCIAIFWEMPDGFKFWQHMSYMRFNLIFTNRQRNITRKP